MAAVLQHIVIVGGGAGGLGLATRLGDKLGRRKKAKVTLVDSGQCHLWKPLLHEIAAGSLDPGVDALSYLAHAHNHHFRFQSGRMTDINRQKKVITLAAIRDQQGELLVAERKLAYDILVLATGSLSNDFNTPGVRQHCIFLDSLQQAQRFHQRMLDLFLKYASNYAVHGLVHIAIVGGGATGVELAAELYNAVQQLHSYGFKGLTRAALKVTLVEAGSRILPALPERIAAAAHEELSKAGVRILTNTKVISARADGLCTGADEFIPADLMVWSAGIKASDSMREIGGLETNRINQLQVNATLQTSRDEAIFAIGDCAFCLQQNGKAVPPRAQAAHQMAECVLHNILILMENHRRLINGRQKIKPLKAYCYKDHGSLVSLSRYAAVGNLMGNLKTGYMMVEGRIARLMYTSLYRMHHIALHGYWKAMLMLLAGRINRVIRPRMKLH